MVIKKWEDLPSNMKNDAVLHYYEILNKKKLSLIVKRLFDIVMSIVLLVLLSPVFLILAIWIKLDSKGPVFFLQERVTQYGKVFRIFKFRTMCNNADQIGNLVTGKNDSRITRVGEKIRKCRLDEIPQLLNILTGDMTFVGTRPEVQKYVDAYTDEMLATLLLPAGVTSLASILYRDEDELLADVENVDVVYIEDVLPGKMKYNLIALEQFNLLNELKVMLKTVF